MTQDLFVPASPEELKLISAPIPEGLIGGINWHRLMEIWLAALSDCSIPAEGWALFMSVDSAHPRVVKGSRDCDLFLLNQGEHPIWWGRCTYQSVFSSSGCPDWAAFAAELDAFHQEGQDNLPFGFRDETDWFADCMINKIAIETMQKIDWQPSHPIGSRFASPNTGQNIHLRTLHPSGGHLFAAARGATYEEAINFSLAYAEQNA